MQPTIPYYAASPHGGRSSLAARRQAVYRSIKPCACGSFDTCRGNLGEVLLCKSASMRIMRAHLNFVLCVFVCVWRGLSRQPVFAEDIHIGSQDGSVGDILVKQARTRVRVSRLKKGQATVRTNSNWSTIPWTVLLCFRLVLRGRGQWPAASSQRV